MVVVRWCAGVGKSTVAVNLAYTLAQMGARVGIFDADVYGPSLPTMVSPALRVLKMDPATRRIEPTQYEGVKLVSFGFAGQGSAIMRGPMVSGALGAPPCEALVRAAWARSATLCCHWVAERDSACIGSLDLVVALHELQQRFDKTRMHARWFPCSRHRYIWQAAVCWGRCDPAAADDCAVGRTRLPGRGLPSGHRRHPADALPGAHGQATHNTPTTVLL